jgi:hypothetical protein
MLSWQPADLNEAAAILFTALKVLGKNPEPHGLLWEAQALLKRVEEAVNYWRDVTFLLASQASASQCSTQAVQQ